MKKLIVPIIILMTLSACSQLGLSSAEPAEPVDLSSIEAKLDTIESKSESQSDEYTKAIKANTKALQENTKALTESKLDKPVAKPKPENKVPENNEVNKPVNKDSINQSDLSYGRIPENPVTSVTPLVIQKDLMETDAQFFSKCFELTPDGCYTDLYVKAGSKITWNYPTGSIIDLNLGEQNLAKFVEFPYQFEPKVMVGMSQLPARMDLLASNFTNSCVYYLEVLVDLNLGNNIPFSRYKIHCI